MSSNMAFMPFPPSPSTPSMNSSYSNMFSYMGGDQFNNPDFSPDDPQPQFLADGDPDADGDGDVSGQNHNRLESGLNDVNEYDLQ